MRPTDGPLRAPLWAPSRPFSGLHCITAAAPTSFAASSGTPLGLRPAHRWAAAAGSGPLPKCRASAGHLPRCGRLRRQHLATHLGRHPAQNACAVTSPDMTSNLHGLGRNRTRESSLNLYVSVQRDSGAIIPGRHRPSAARPAPAPHGQGPGHVGARLQRAARVIGSAAVAVRPAARRLRAAGRRSARPDGSRRRASAPIKGGVKEAARPERGPRRAPAPIEGGPCADRRSLLRRSNFIIIEAGPCADRKRSLRRSKKAPAPIEGAPFDRRRGQGIAPDSHIGPRPRRRRLRAPDRRGAEVGSGAFRAMSGQAGRNVSLSRPGGPKCVRDTFRAAEVGPDALSLLARVPPGRTSPSRGTKSLRLNSGRFIHGAVPLVGVGGRLGDGPGSDRCSAGAVPAGAGGRPCRPLKRV